MPNFKTDLKQETILSQYLDGLYGRKGIDFIRIFDLKKQLQGIDVIMKINSREYFIDEKSQLHYLNKDLPTFTFELSYLKNGKLKEGWLLSKRKCTQYYFLITGISLRNGKGELRSPDDIKNLKITSVNRKKLTTHLNSIGLGKNDLLEYDLKLREGKSFGKNKIAELNSKSEGLIYFTEHLQERPINLQLRLAYLINQKIAKKFHYS